MSRMPDAASREARVLLRRIRVALGLLGVVLVGGTIGYLALGSSPLDAFYRTVTTVTTVGAGENRPLSGAAELFTVALILAGVGTVLYTFGALLEIVVEGHLMQLLEARRMERTIDRMRGHVIICGWGRVGQAAAAHLLATGHQVVVIDRDPARLSDIAHPWVLGDISDDDVLRSAGLATAHALVAALETDADNVYVTLSARALRPDLVLIARARSEESTAKLLRAGADRVVNPQLIGGRRMAAFALQPHVAEFLDVVMHDDSLDVRIAQVEVHDASPLCGRTLAEAGLASSPGATILAVRHGRGGEFVANPDATARLGAASILIAVGTPEQLHALRGAAGSDAGRGAVPA